MHAKTKKEREAHSLRSNLDRRGWEKDIGEKGLANRRASKVVGVRKEYITSEVLKTLCIYSISIYSLMIKLTNNLPKFRSSKSRTNIN